MYRIARTALIAGTGCAVAVSVYPDRTAGEVKDGLFTAMYKNVAFPLVLSNMDPEDAHSLMIKAAKMKLVPYDRVPDSPALGVRALGLNLRNPVGLAAGCDHNAEGVEAFDKMGFGFVEVGSVTPQPQQGTPRPRVFRLLGDRGVINRVGYANEGAGEVQKRLKALREGGYKGVIGVNLGMNKGSSPSEDFAAGIEMLGPYADYLVLNAAQLYHPPIPSFRSAKHPQELEKVLTAALVKRGAVCPRVPLLVKLHPDFPDKELREVCHVIKASGADGIVMSAPSAQRPDSIDGGGPNSHEFGGLSGAPIATISKEALSKVFKYTGGQLPLIGVGGISSGKDAYERVRAGASAVQLYTALAYEGPYAVPRIKWEMEELAKGDGFASVQDAIGADAKGIEAHNAHGELTHRFSTWWFSPDGGSS